VSIDVIIFDDGLVVGPNTTHFDTELENRKLAATVVAKQIRNAQARGEDPKDTLERIASSMPMRDDTLATWTVRYAKILAHCPKLERQLQALEKLPEPPAFHK